ncbi:MAG: class I SAM-dependent rRNA methyltransferase [Bacteroidales bacterium]|nr:class I SAM-dependent rRNA methyltransferase [Bacteroidales bacterium]
MRRHPWIFSGAVRKIVGEPQEGDLVDVVSADGRWLAVGHYQSDSIVCKVLSFDTQRVDEAFFRERLQSAIAYRERLGFFGSKKEELRTKNWADNSQFRKASQFTNVFRLVHAEGDFMPGLVCDWYNGVLVMQAHSVGMHRLFPMLTGLFVDLLGKHGIKSVFDKSSATVPGGCEDGYIWGDEPEEWVICEHGNRLLINFYEGQKTGFFVDQRENRNLVSTLAEGQRVLNCFGYTGGFSLAALHGGASYVETVDISKKAIGLCNRNVELNYGNEAPHKGVVADVLKYLEEVDNQFNLIILDPPAFAKNHRSLQHGLKGYRNINQRAMEKIRPGGLLLTFSCSQAVSNDDFKTVCFTAAANAHKQVRIVRQLPHAMDHPVSIYHPEGEYLKGLLLEIE